jgi:glycosyltransferase involved in cell wall biosynthesis
MLELVRGALDAEAYQTMLARADLILLPYDPELYRSRGSGVLAEAICLAKPVVAPAGSGIGEEVAAGRAAGVLFTAFDAPAIAAAIGEALAGLEPLTQQAAVIAEARGEQHSGPGYVAQLRAWAGR